MGAFFTNVQVRTEDTGALITALREDALARGLDEVGADGAPDRSVLVLPPQDGWITIYDEATEGQDGTSLAALATLASRAAGALAFSAMVHDSDMCAVELFDRGARIDRFDSDPTYYGSVRRSKAERSAVAGDASAWAPLVGDGSVEALSAAFKSETLFAEGALAKIAELAGCDTHRVFRGYRYATMDGDPLPEGTTTLRFRARARPAYEIESTAPPALVTESYVEGELTLAVGDELHGILGARSVGRSSTGLEVRCWGSALDGGHVEVDHFQLVIGDARQPGAITRVDAELQRSDGQTMYVATLGNLRLPAGPAAPFEGFRPGMDMMRVISAMQLAKVRVNVIGRVTAPGRCELGMALVPLEGGADAGAATIARLALDPTFERPLRSCPQPSSSDLRLVAADSHLTLLIALADRAALRRLAAQLLAVLAPELDGADHVQTLTYFADGVTRPRMGRGKVKTMLLGKRVERLLAEVEEAATVTITAGVLTLHAGTGILQDGQDRAPWLQVSIAVRGRDGVALRERLTALVDDAMQWPGSLQATLTPSGGGIEHEVTPYERACQHPYDTATLRALAERWVRVPGRDRVWLGPLLTSRLDRALWPEGVFDEEAIAQSGPSSQQESQVVTRLTLRQGAAGRDLEAALAPLLATAEDIGGLRVRH